MTDKERCTIAAWILMSAAELAALILCGDEPASGDIDRVGSICLHPDDARVNLTVMGGSKKWLCRLCGHQFGDGQEERLMVKVERVEFAYVPVGSLVPFAGIPGR